MKTFLTILILTQGFLFAHCDGCGAESEKITEHAHGSLVGNVKYEGKVPKPRPLNMDADAICGKAHTNQVLSESFVVDDNMNLKNVLVWFKDISYTEGPDSTPAVLDQNGCVYSPHVTGIMKDQKVIIKNSDETMHNIHSMSKVNNQFNYAMPKVIKEKETSFTLVEEPFKIKCDVHPWMNSWVLVQDHPYFAVTDASGNFKIENIPPGTYEVVAWQEKFKMKRSITKTVTIVDSSETTQDFVFIKPTKK